MQRSAAERVSTLFGGCCIDQWLRGSLISRLVFTNSLLVQVVETLASRRCVRHPLPYCMHRVWPDLLELPRVLT
jgi:hypothetical protein